MFTNYMVIMTHFNLIILINLFKSYCRSFYGSMLWKYNSEVNIIVKTCMNNAVYNSNTCNWIQVEFFSKYLLFMI